MRLPSSERSSCWKDARRELAGWASSRPRLVLSGLQLNKAVDKKGQQLQAGAWLWEVG